MNPVHAVSFPKIQNQVAAGGVCPAGAMVAIIGVSAALALVGTLHLEKDRIVLRDSSEALSFLNDWLEFLRSLLPS
jgi:hypothetical protein